MLFSTVRLVAALACVSFAVACKHCQCQDASGNHCCVLSLDDGRFTTTGERWYPGCAEACAWNTNCVSRFDKDGNFNGKWGASNCIRENTFKGRSYCNFADPNPRVEKPQWSLSVDPKTCPTRAGCNVPPKP